MSKPARPTLSDVLPSKGAATRPEPMPDQAPGSTAKAEPVAKEKRVPITVKLRAATYERLRAASFHEKADKQDLVDKALDETLGRMGY